MEIDIDHKRSYFRVQDRDLGESYWKPYIARPVKDIKPKKFLCYVDKGRVSKPNQNKKVE